MKNLFFYERNTKQFFGAFEDSKKAHDYIKTTISGRSGLQDFFVWEQTEGYISFEVDQLVYEVLIEIPKNVFMNKISDFTLTSFNHQMGKSVQYFDSSDKDQVECLKEITEVVNLEILKEVSSSIGFVLSDDVLKNLEVLSV